jgi:hypothetical protein
MSSFFKEKNYNYLAIFIWPFVDKGLWLKNSLKLPNNFKLAARWRSTPDRR